MEFDAMIVTVMLPFSLSITAYGIQMSFHAIVDSAEEKWRKKYMKNLIRVYGGK